MNINRYLKLLIWSYFWLLILEGALRKWILPGLATPLLLVRDPIVIVALLMAFGNGKMKFNGYLITAGFVAVTAPLLAVTLGHGNVIVAAFGWRANFLHLPFIFLIGQFFDKDDVKKMGVMFMLVCIGMTLLIAMQFHSPQGSWLNIGIGGEGDSGFDGAMGYRRPSGSFSFTSGVSIFFPFAAAFTIAEFMSSRITHKLTAILAALAILAAIPISISRGLLIGVILVIFGAIIALPLGGKSVGRIIRVIVITGITAIGATFLPGLEKPREAFLSRWEAATTNQGGVEEAIVQRSIDGFLSGINFDSPNLIEGGGLGMGTNAGARLLTGKSVFLISEGEWGRLIGEMGLPLGIIFISVRVVLGLHLFRESWKTAKRGEPLALILFFAGGSSLVQGQWGQPTSLGFAILGAGMMLAVIRSSKVSRRHRTQQITAENDSPVRVLELSIPANS